jgi:hypothetical protein
MFVVRSKGMYAPKQLAAELGTTTRFYPNPDYPNRQFDWASDFFMRPVAPQHARNHPPEFIETYNFGVKNKYGQRRTLSEKGIPVPACAADQNVAATLTGERFVVRPLRHTRSMGYRVTSDRLDFSPGKEYISELYPKRREYRLTFVFGKPLIWLRKKQNEGVSPEEPWGHTNSKFQTINNTAASPLSATTAVDTLSGLDIIKGSHIVAADIMWNPDAAQPWVCLELNFCPSLEIENNRNKVKDAIRSRVTAS